MIELQKFLFESTPKRMELMDYVPSSKNEYTIHVYRNHSFELVEHTLTAYLDYADIKGVFTYSDYDDSLSFYQIDTSADMILLWLDMTRYHQEKMSDFLKERLNYLSSIYRNPILLVQLEGESIEMGGNVYCYNMEDIKSALKGRYIEERLEALTGTKLSAKACMQVSRELGLKYIPGLLKPTLKAIIVDLDNTLYEGVLGEDGESGIRLSDGHRKLQESIKKLKEKGFFVCIASKNEEKDVMSLFQTRKDFILKKEDFSMICASWQSKAQMIGEIASYLNIHTDSMIFIDDNIGELMSVKEEHPSIHVIHASQNPLITDQVLTHYPGLWKARHQQEDEIRTADIKAKKSREELQKSLSKEEYLKSLKMELEYDLDDREKAGRIAELSNKTNQFIFNYKRYTLSEVERLMTAEDSLVIAVKLKDRLSNSGMIGACVFRVAADCLVLEECFVSCRALGRGIEEVIILGSISIAQKHFSKEKVKVLFQKGERNTPAEVFVHQHLEPCLAVPEEIRYQMPEEMLTISIK